MSTKNNRWMFVSTIGLFAALLALVILSTQASAAQAPDPTGNSCLTCHEDLYYLHDTGKWYCITVHADHCAACHGGNADSLKEEQAHLGLIAHPQKDNGAKCQECHSPEETQVRLEKFASLAGLDEVVETGSYVPLAEVSTGAPTVVSPEPFFENWPWLVFAAVLFGLWLALVLFSPTKP